MDHRVINAAKTITATKASGSHCYSVIHRQDAIPLTLRPR